MVQEIVKFGASILRRRCAPIESVDADVESLIEDLFESMRAAEGVGLAAPQIGVPRRVVVVDVSAHEPANPPIALINPRLAAKKGREIAEEGCLSLPELYGDVARPTHIEVEALNRKGESIHFSAEGFYARALQHEIDHLDGKLFIDYISPLKRQLMRAALKRLKMEGEAWDKAHP